MKITCEYCGTEYDDTLTNCPACGAVNNNQRKSTHSVPLTIEELKQWYADKNLPPYEVTRFFIGQDYRKPRAFGIYKDLNTGNVIVYKNKDNGERAVRYEGTDEAFAVSEILTRLKQEVVLQKQNQIPAGYNATPESTRSTEAREEAVRKVKRTKKLITTVAMLLAVCMLLPCCGLPVAKTIITGGNSQEGYYSYNNNYYFRWDSSSNYYRYNPDKKDWEYCENNETMPPMFRRKAQEYYLGFDYDEGAAYTDFTLSKPYCDNYYPMSEGYYDFNNEAYYLYVNNKDKSMLKYGNGEWSIIDDSEIPYELTYSLGAEDYYLGSKYSEDYRFSNVKDSDAYIDLKYPNGPQTGYYESDGSYYYHDSSYYSSKWYEFSDDDDLWILVDENDVPEDLWLQSSATDFYYVPDWDSETQINDFEVQKQEEYDRQHENDDDSWSSWDNDDDDWGSSWDDDDSWDSGSTDWDSDW